MITKNLYLDTKNTIWHRSYIVIEGETEQELQKQIDNFTFSEFFSNYEEVESEYLFDTVEDLYLDENQYNPTIELIENNGKDYKTLKDNLSSIKKEDVKMFSINDISKLWQSLYKEDLKADFYGKLLEKI